MLWLLQLNLDRFLVFTLVLTRVSGLVISAPIFGGRESPMQIRALLAFAISILVMPTQWDAAVVHPGSMLNYLVLIGTELLIGLCLGLGIEILFSGMQLAGQVISQVGGLMVASVFDPTSGEDVPIFSRVLLMLTLVVFVCIGGHRLVMAGLLNTFTSIPPGHGALPVAMGDTFQVLLTQSFSLGVRVAAPATTALLLSTLVLGLIGRTLPQLNILAVGFGLNSMLTFGITALTLGAGIMLVQSHVEPALNAILESLHQSVSP